MAAKDRKTREPVRRIRVGEAITARYLNRLGAGVNQSLANIKPPRSLKIRSTDEQINVLTNEPGRRFVETASIKSIVRVYQDDDPTSDNWVDVERYDEVTFEAGTESITLVFDRT